MLKRRFIRCESRQNLYRLRVILQPKLGQDSSDCKTKIWNANRYFIRSNPASVTFNGDDLPYNVAYSGHAKEYAGKISTGTFAYTNTESTVFTNSTPVMDTLAYEVGFDTIVKSQANTFTWIGNPLAANERANLFVGSWTWGEDASFFAFTTGSTNIILGVNQLSNLALGTSTCYIDRVNEVATTQGTSEGGLIRTRYRPTNVQIQVVP